MRYHFSDRAFFGYSFLPMIMDCSLSYRILQGVTLQKIERKNSSLQMDVRQWLESKRPGIA